jgi:hypothetical protein
MVLMAILPAPLTLALLFQALHSRRPLRLESSSKPQAGEEGRSERSHRIR